MPSAKRFAAASEVKLSGVTAAPVALGVAHLSACEQALPQQRVTIGQALTRIFGEPRKYLLSQWNWKSALLSSAMRATLFFFVNLSGGWAAARAALLTELVFRAATSGFYGAITEIFRDADPPEAAALTVMVLLPLANHSLEFLVHWLRGTHNLAQSILASMLLTAFSSLFNLYVMRRGALIVGAGHSSLTADLRRMPLLIMDFTLLIPRYCRNQLSRRCPATPTDGL